MVSSHLTSKVVCEGNGGSETHSLHVNSVRMKEESYTVCANVKFYLDHPNAWDGSEAADVAEQIEQLF